MRSVTLAPGADQDGFRSAVRRLMAAGVPPQDVVWAPMPGLFAPDVVGEAPPLSLLPRATILAIFSCAARVATSGSLSTMK